MKKRLYGISESKSNFTTRCILFNSGIVKTVQTIVNKLIDNLILHFILSRITVKKHAWFAKAENER